MRLFMLPRMLFTLPYRLKIYIEFNLETWFRFVNLTELNINEFLFLNFNYKISNQ